jgi:hypothetical protein
MGLVCVRIAAPGNQRAFLISLSIARHDNVWEDLRVY